MQRKNFITYIFPLFALLLCMGTIPAAGAVQGSANPQLLFDRANDRFQSGEYRAALDGYLRLEDSGSVSGPLFLNMGLGYIQVDSLGKAKYYLLKASEYPATREGAEQALEYVNSNLSHQSAVLPKLPWEKAIDWIHANMKTGTLLGIGLFLLNIGVIAYILPWFMAHYSKILQNGGWISAGLGILILLLSFYVQYRDNRYSKAVMIRSQARVTEQPRADAPVLNQAYEGYTFTIDHNKSREQPGWSYVRMSNGMYGWISSRNIRAL